MLKSSHLSLLRLCSFFTFMLFLKMYPGSEKPFFLSIGSLKITSCSKRKTRLSLALDRKPLSCSATVKVSCWSSLPWAVIFPWYHSKYINITKWGSGCRVFFMGQAAGMRNVWKRFEGWSRFPETYLEALQSAHIHHVIATFWHKAHHFYCFLFETQKWAGC